MMNTKSLANTWCVVLVAGFALIGALRAEARWLGAGVLSPQALAADKVGTTLYVAEFTANRVDVYNLKENARIKTIALAAQPSGLALSPDGSRLYVTGAAPDGQVFVVSLPGGKVAGTIAVGHTPQAPVPSPDGKLLYVCNRFSNDVSVVDLANKKEVARIAVLREPVAAAVSPDGKTLLVANSLPSGPADGEEVAAMISVIDTAQRKVATTIKLPNGSTSLRAVCLSPDGRFAYVTHGLARYQLPTTQLERGWMNTAGLSIIDVVRRERVATILLDDVEQGAANPWAAACTADGKTLCVTHAGSQELSLIDREGLHAKLEHLAAQGKPGEATMTVMESVADDLSFLAGLRRRVRLAGNGPRSLVLVGPKAYVGEYFTDTVSIMDLSPNARLESKVLHLGSGKKITIERRGEMLFNDAALCFQQWQSCASCHPGEARTDGLNWDLLNDGIGNPKNTRSMLLAHRTPPVMWRGVRERAETAVRAGIKHIQFAERPEEDAVAIDQYLKSLKPVPSPHLAKGRLSKAARRGEKLFAQADCARCHPAPLYTDQKAHNLGTGKGPDQGQAMVTPTLVEVWRTAPYLHDGRATTIKEMLTRFNPGDEHGVTSRLSGDQIYDLAEFVLSR